MDRQRLDRQMLAEVLLWRADAPTWAQIEQLLTRIADSISRGDLPGVRRDVTGLALLGPSRVSTPINPGIAEVDQTRTVPENVAELLNTLVDRLTPDQPATPDE